MGNQRLFVLRGAVGCAAGGGDYMGREGGAGRGRGHVYLQTHCPTALAPNLSARPALASSSLRRRVFRIRLVVGKLHSSSSAQSASETQAMREETHVEAKSYEYCNLRTSWNICCMRPSAAPSALSAGAANSANGTGASLLAARATAQRAATTSFRTIV